MQQLAIGLKEIRCLASATLGSSVHLTNISGHLNYHKVGSWDQSFQCYC